MKNQQKLIVMVGLPGSGKSTKGKQVAEDNDFAYIQRDFIHQMTELKFSKKEQSISKNIFLGFLEAALFRGETVVADATHLNSGSRAPIIELGKQYGVEIIALAMNTSYETCILRNSKRDELTKVPTETLRAMKNSFSLPSKHEGFHNIYIYNEGEDWKWE